MKLIIDIPDEKYKTFQSGMYCGMLDADLYHDIKNGKPLDDELQEIRKDIAEYKDDKIIHAEKNEMIDIVLEIIDSHISALNNDQFERIWQNTVEEMKRRKICEDILEEAEEWDSETMSGSLLTDDDLRLLINDAIKKKKAEQDKVTQWIKDNAGFIKEMARMLEEADNAESEE